MPDLTLLQDILILIALGAYFLLALASFSPQDPGWSQVGAQSAIRNAGGAVGAWFADITLFLFGLFAYLIPVTVAWPRRSVFTGRRTWPASQAGCIRRREAEDEISRAPAKGTQTSSDNINTAQLAGWCRWRKRPLNVASSFAAPPHCDARNAAMRSSSGG